MPSPNPYINGHRYQWSSIAVEIPTAGGTYLAVKSINYTMTKKPSKVYGTTIKPIGRTRGRTEPEASLEMYAEEANDFIALLGATGGFMDQSFNITVMYSEENNPSVILDTLLACQISKVEDSHAEGTEGLTKKFELDVMDISYNGNDAVFPGPSPGVLNPYPQG